jgi:ammonium transporter, Amt family
MKKLLSILLFSTLSTSALLAQPAVHNAQERSVRIEEKLNAIIQKLEKTEPTQVPAQSLVPETTTATAGQVQKNLNYVWMVIAGMVVFLMQAGFAMVELGMSRAKNSINIVMKNFLDFAISCMAFLAVGFGLMFGTTAGGWLGTDGFWLSSVPGDSPLWCFWFYQAIFAGTACTIVSGAMAERTKFLGYLAYAAVLSALIYPVCGHWVWGSLAGSFGLGGTQGWLQTLGYIDFAGSSVVHACGGACALAGIIVVGARQGRFGKDGTPRMIAGHNIPLAALGVFLLWMGWFGFNAGSTLIADASIGRIVANTTVGPAAAAFTAMISMWYVQGRPDVGITLNGALGGAVGITASCHMITPGSAMLIGAIAGILTTLLTVGLEKMCLDDAVGAVPVHLGNGIWGTLAVALFDEKGFNLAQLGVQSAGVLAIVGMTFLSCFALFKLIHLSIGLRADDLEQADGLDFAEHAANAYPDFQTTEQV